MFELRTLGGLEFASVMAIATPSRCRPSAWACPRTWQVHAALGRALESMEAQGWHTLVFGLTLAIYSVPLRQGLLGYAQQVMLGFIHSAAARFSVSMAEIDELMTELNSPLPMALGSLLFIEGLEQQR